MPTSGAKPRPRDSRRGLLALFFLASLLYAATGAAQAPAPTNNALNGDPWSSIEPIAWRQLAFNIPFRVNRQANSTDAPAEVHLLVTTDPRAPWQLAGRTAPEAGFFAFRAPHDGQYWFSIQVVDRAGRPWPGGPPTPTLSVLVDTTAPRLDLAATRGPGGEIQLQWQAVDLNLQPDSLKFEYQADPAADWHRVAIEPSNSGPPGTLQGTALCWPEQRVGTITVRGEVVDRAGNRTVTQTQVAMEAGANQPVARQPAHHFAQDTPFSGTGVSGTGSPNWSPLDASYVAAPTSQAWPAESSQTPLPRALSRNAVGAANQPGVQMPAGPAPNDAQNSAMRYASQVRIGQTAPRGGSDMTMRWVNAQAFDLQYDVISGNPADLVRVELWGTADNGQSWQLFKTDSDLRSPITAEVAREGRYGFRIVTTDRTGQGASRPQPGDQPEIWVAVDLTPPKVRIVGIEPTSEPDTWLILWEAADAHLNPRPVSLSYSLEPGGRGTHFAMQLENTGNYRWRIPRDVPETVYLRVEVEDAAGNIGVAETATPVFFSRR